MSGEHPRAAWFDRLVAFAAVYYAALVVGLIVATGLRYGAEPANWLFVGSVCAFLLGRWSVTRG